MLATLPPSPTADGGAPDPRQVVFHGLVAGEAGIPAAVARILCLKLDHVGDLMIAMPALAMLRASFPDAHITLVCAPWNRGLAERLEIADRLCTIDFFSQNSLADLDAAEVERQRLAAVAQFEALDLPRFDLAIDLRRDEDTRPLLTLADAGVRAGFGDAMTFGYLDVALPYAKHGPAAGMSLLRLRPADLNRGQGHVVSAHGLHLTEQQAHVDVEIATDAVWPPADDGENDYRDLGAALWRVDALLGESGGSPVAVPRGAMTFGPGWLDWESWGRWSTMHRAGFSVDLPASSPEMQLFLGVQGHTSPSHPRAAVTVSSGGAAASHVFHAGDEAATLALTVRPRISTPAARSDPYLLRGGRYRGEVRVHLADRAAWQPVSIIVRTARWRHVLARLVLPDEAPGEGELSFPLELEVRDSADPIELVVEAPEPDCHHGLAIAGVDLAWQQGRIPPLPQVHMERQLLDLVAMVALRHAPGGVRAGGDIAARLTTVRDGSTAGHAARAVQARKRPGWLRRRSDRVIGIGIGANKETKLWPEANWLDLCRRLLAQGGVTLAFVGGPREAEDVRRLLGRLGAGRRGLDLVACCRIEDLGEVLGEMDAYIGLDTGTTHFAGRIGVPTLALFGASHDPAEWGPVGERTQWIAADLTCRGCSLSLASQCTVALRCMAELTPAAVWPLVERLVTGGRHPA